jgi:hypothetical protein
MRVEDASVTLIGCHGPAYETIQALPAELQRGEQVTTEGVGPKPPLRRDRSRI